jgi:hypothetical protein
VHYDGARTVHQGDLALVYPSCTITQHVGAKGCALRGGQRGKGRAFSWSLLIFVVVSPGSLPAPTLIQVNSAATQSELTGREGRDYVDVEAGADGGGPRPVPAALGDEKFVAAVGESRVSSEHVDAVRAKGKHARWCCPCDNVAGVPGMGFEVAARGVRPHARRAGLGGRNRTLLRENTACTPNSKRIGFYTRITRTLLSPQGHCTYPRA